MAGVAEMGFGPDGRRINQGCGSTHLEPLRAAVLEQGAAQRAGQLLRGLGRTGCQADRVHRGRLKLRRQRHSVDTGDGLQFRHLLRGHLGFASRHKLRHIARVDRHRPGLGLHRLGNAKPLEHMQHMDAAFGALVAGKGLRRQHRAFESLHRTDLGLRCAGLHRNADAGFGVIDTARELARCDKPVGGGFSDVDRVSQRLVGYLPPTKVTPNLRKGIFPVKGSKPLMLESNGATFKVKMTATFTVAGTYVIYLKITDSPEIPVLTGGQLRAELAELWARYTEERAAGRKRRLEAKDTPAAKKAGWTKERWASVQDQMMSGDYQNLLSVAVTEFEVH